LTIRPPKPLILLGLVLGFLVIRNYLNIKSAELVSLAYPSGWLLFGSFLLLALYGMRKKFPFLPLGTTSSWLQLHLGVGLLSGYLFLLHTGFVWPQGRFEVALYFIYLVLMVSGFIGWFLMRWLPKAMRTDVENLHPSRIPSRLREILEEGDALVLKVEEGALSERIIMGYTEVIRPFLNASPGFFQSKRHSELEVPTPIVHKLAEYLPPSVLFSTESSRPFHGLIREKADLDRMVVYQRWIRGWLFLHVPLTAVLFILIVLHTILVLGFSSGGA
jgi:hypothetical protein